MTIHAAEPLQRSASTNSGGSCDVTILMPCLNEAESIGICIRKAFSFLKSNNIVGEVLIADNGSTDDSVRVSIQNGARVIHAPTRGYGGALREGIRLAYGQYVVMGDADDSYDFAAIGPFIDALREGSDLVMGNRFKGGIEPGAMPYLHRWLGNPVLSGIGRLFYGAPIRDFHCGLRGFNREAILALGLITNGMEFASEMVVKASLSHLKISEVPVTLSVDKRSRKPHLRTWRDGWRHLRFLLLYSPSWMFLYPGIAMMLLGSGITVTLAYTRITIKGVSFDVHTLLYSVALVLLGYQCASLFVISKVFAARVGFLPMGTLIRSIYKRFSLELGLVISILLAVAGITLSFSALGDWQHAGFKTLDPVVTLRKVIPAVSLIVLGVQTAAGSLFLSFLQLELSVTGNQSVESGQRMPVRFAARGWRRQVPPQ